MLIRRVTLENFGLYSGEVEFDLEPRVKYRQLRPIILFGGMNGAGKTTLLEALRLVFYGRASLGPRVPRAQYDAYLRDRIHRAANSLLPNNFARIRVEFDHVRFGVKEQVVVERAWTTKNGKGIEEFLRIAEGGGPLEDVTPEQWRGTIDGIIPERMSQLFFFDGEKIKSIAEDETGSQALADAIKTLLGLDIVEQLDADLAIYHARLAKQHLMPDQRQAVDRIEADLKRLAKEEVECQEQAASLQTQIAAANSEVSQLEGDLRLQGASYASMRDDLKARQASAATRIEEIEKGIRTECDGVFPLALCPNTVRRLRGIFEREQDSRRCKAAARELQAARERVEEVLANIGGGIGKKVRAKLARELAKAVQPPEVAGGGELAPVLDYSENEEQLVLGWLAGAEGNAVSTMADLTSRLSRATDELAQVTKDLAKAPDDDVLRPAHEALAAANARIGELQEKVRVAEDMERTIGNDIAARKRELQKVLDRQKDSAAVHGRLTMVKRVREVLATYLTRLTSRKVEQLRRTVAECYNRLCRKGDVLRKIDIDANTFAVTLYDRHNRAIPKTELSAGEKQIYAVAMLWALAKTSGRPLPVIIDTPLGRLDSAHRSKLVDNYFPYASHQVVLLSTDTEVDQGLFKRLSPQVSHCYHLRFDEVEGNTTASEEYFWRESESA